LETHRLKILTAEASNFQSYKELSFDYSHLGLALVSGQTGSGKSTLLDLPTWVLFGTTSKEGAADDVKAWDGPGATVGEVRVSTPTGDLLVTRSRGKGSNDLYWVEIEHGGTQQVRGKDLTDTQRLLETRLGVSADLFLTGSYLTQFSKADTFFIAKAKDRRDVLEKIADQEFAISLGEKASTARKATKASLETATTEVTKLIERKAALEEEQVNLEQAIVKWEDKQQLDIAAMKHRIAGFEQEKQEAIAKTKEQLSTLPQVRAELKKAAERLAKEQAQYQELSDGLSELKAERSQFQQTITDCSKTDCPTCKRPFSGKENNASLVAELKGKLESLNTTLSAGAAELTNLRMDISHCEIKLRSLNQHLGGLEALKGRLAEQEKAENPYTNQLQALTEQTNPFEERYKVTEQRLEDTRERLKVWIKGKADLEHEFTSLTWLYDRSFELRGILMQQAVLQLERSTNRLLERYFDAALRVSFALEGSDKLEVEIFNDGHTASFRQLSGGERCMLKLCFSLSLMKAAQNKAGISFGAVFLDEPLNGLDEGLKSKAFGLLQELENDYSTVLVIEHSTELKQHFSNVFNVEKVGGHSVINGASFEESQDQRKGA
jgi:DNA repair exonuclease SbcCD ATPase subunit